VFVGLHSYMTQLENAHTIPKGFVDSEEADGKFIPGN